MGSLAFNKFLNLSGQVGILRCKIYLSVWRTWKGKCPSRNRLKPWALRDLSGLPASFTYTFSLLIEGLGLSYSMLIFILPSGLLIHNSGFTPSQMTSRSTAKSDLFHISHKMAHHCKRNTPQTKLILPLPQNASLEFEISELTVIPLFLWNLIYFIISPNIFHSFLILCYNLHADP